MNDTTISSEEHAPCPRCVSAAPAPSQEEAQERQPGVPPRRGWVQAAAVPAAVLPLLPSFTCPACIAA